MDLARTCYTTEALFFRDNASVCTIKWYRAPEGAKVFPVAHKWGQLRWYSRPWEAEGVGEVFGAATAYFNGFTPPTSRGQSFVGPEEYFQLGCKFDPLTDVNRDVWGLAISCSGIPDCAILQEPVENPVILLESNPPGLPVEWMLLESCP